VVPKDELLENYGEVVSEDLCRRDCNLQQVLLGGNLVNQEIIEKFRNWRKKVAAPQVETFKFLNKCLQQIVDILFMTQSTFIYRTSILNNVQKQTHCSTFLTS
jgi:hypothetical protein